MHVFYVVVTGYTTYIQSTRRVTRTDKAVVRLWSSQRTNTLREAILHVIMLCTVPFLLIHSTTNV